METNGNPIVHDWYSADDWARQKLGIFGTAGPTGISPAQWTHLRKALDHARRFRNELAYNASLVYPAIAVLAGETQPTPWTVMRNGPHSVRGWDFASGSRKPGDNRVQSTKALPPSGVPHRVFKSSRSHEELLNDTTQVESILAQLSR